MVIETVIDARFDPVDLLASMMFADEVDSSWIEAGGMRKSSTGAVYEEIDAGSRLLFDAMKPTFAYTFDMIDNGRLISTSPEYLLYHPSDVIGRSAEVVMLTHDRLKWSGFRRMQKAPRGVWVSSPGASLYEFHYREVFPDGRNTYRRRVAAIGKSGKPVQTAIVGSQGAPAADGFIEGTMLIMAASVIEDSYRAGAIRCEITDGNTIIAPIPLGAQKPLFALRDGPMTGRGRRRAILHHVIGHARTSVNGNAHGVRDHFRGVVEFVIDGLRVKLTANDKRPD
jgi:hypothetical protein